MASTKNRNAWKMIRTACRIRSRIRGHREGDLNNGRAESRAEVQNPGKWNIAFGYWTNKKYSGGNDRRTRLLETVTRAAVLSYSSDRFPQTENGQKSLPNSVGIILYAVSCGISRKIDNWNSQWNELIKR